ncbi:cupin domain-containing protein [Opitutaceae bacterium EW11]|nr:cupin domain-containing protein [Opitutaceae bacterium EW11]
MIPTNPSEALFPGVVLKLPEADIPVPGLRAYLSQAVDHQVLFMQFSEDVEIPEHAHEAQWGIVLEGTIELTVEGRTQRFRKGDRYLIPAGAKHRARIEAGYADITYFDSPSRYRVRPGTTGR